MKITNVRARQILDSRGNPTVECDVTLENGVMGRAAVPSGASTGEREAMELRDGDAKVYGGKGVLKAVGNVNTDIKNMLLGKSIFDQAMIDQAMIDLDGTPNKSRLGANAILAVSLACAKVAALAQNKLFYVYLHELSGTTEPMSLPMPTMNVVNGGQHAEFATDIQEFMIVPIGAKTFSQALQMGVSVFHELRKVLKARSYSTNVGDEGGFAPVWSGGNEEALDSIVEAITSAGYKSGVDVSIALDVAASEFVEEGVYTLQQDGKHLTTGAMIGWYRDLISKYPIISIEDGLEQNDWGGWMALHKDLGDGIMIVGDDLLVTNPKYIQRGIESKSANAVIVKVNQVGTLSETIAAIKLAQDAGWKAIVANRSGETEDTTIADLAVGLGTGWIKTGSLSRSERVAKYNQLLRIEEALGPDVLFANHR